MIRRALFVVLAAVVVLSSACTQADKGWVSLFDGETLNGWKASEHPYAFRIEDDAIVCDGERSHLFYMGGDSARFKNFEFKADVMFKENANSGIYFHTEYQKEGWPSKGYEAQVCGKFMADNGYIERKKTGSLYGIRNLYKSPVRANEWFNYYIIVKGRTIRIKINDQLMVDYTEDDGMTRPENLKGRELSSGTFALQCHDPESRVYFKNIKVKPLPDDIETPGVPVENAELDARITRLHSQNFPLIDYHIHLKGGLTMEQALAHSREYGITYGIAVNCGLNFPISDDESLQQFIDSYVQPPQTFFGMQAEGREWVVLFSKESIEKFDYVFTDAMTWTNDDGKRMRLWIEDEVEVGDPQHFMDMLVDRIEKIMTEPIDIYVNPTFLPKEIADRYDELWTQERIDRVVKALAENNIALEINARYKLPSAKIIKQAKAAGVKFTFGTNNTGPDFGHLEYCLEMIKECNLEPDDMWYPEAFRVKTEN